MKTIKRRESGYRAMNKEWEEQYFFYNLTAICEPIA
jgi:hypothetical protein